MSEDKIPPKKRVLSKNSRGEVQISLFFPEKTAAKIWADYDNAVIIARGEGKMKPRAKEYFYNKYFKSHLEA
jgi:hypothetical protein